MPDGLPVLKESLRMLTTYYPEQTKRIYFYRPNIIFRSIFRIFSLWVPADTRAKFVIVREGEEKQYFLAPGVIDPMQAPPELGGQGKPLDGDRFLAAAISRYDSLASLPAVE